LFAYLWDRINQMQQELDQLKKENEDLRKKVASIEPVHIERIEYKIQELHVETLSGTLNVGLTANGDEQSVARLVERLQQEGKNSFDLGEWGPGPSSGKTSPPSEPPPTSSIPVQQESSQSADSENKEDPSSQPDS
jgi:spore germination protein PC